jgi:hypothetical protein
LPDPETNEFVKYYERETARGKTGHALNSPPPGTLPDVAEENRRLSKVFEEIAFDLLDGQGFGEDEEDTDVEGSDSDDEEYSQEVQSSTSDDDGDSD